MSPSLFLFWALVAVVVSTAASAALARNLVYAALSLGASLAGVAGLYLFLQAEYLAVVQMTVYVGGILILILFGVMFSRDLLGTATAPSWPARILGGITFLAVLVGSGRTAWVAAHRGQLPSPSGSLEMVRSAPETWVGNIASDSPVHLGTLLMDKWLVPFLVIAMLLTVVLVAALGLVRKENTP